MSASTITAKIGREPPWGGTEQRLRRSHAAERCRTLPCSRVLACPVLHDMQLSTSPPSKGRGTRHAPATQKCGLAEETLACGVRPALAAEVDERAGRTRGGRRVWP